MWRPDEAPFAVMRDARSGRWLSFRAPRAVITAHREAEVLPALAAVEQAVQRQGLWAAGFLSYEAAPALDPALQTHSLQEFPLLWFVLGDVAEVLPAAALRDSRPVPDLSWRPSVDEATYLRRIAAIKERIRAGDTYQVNYTYRLHSPFGGEPWPLFAKLVRAQPRGFAAFVDTGRWCVCSASPELFLEAEGEQVVSRPMKGTARRGLWAEDDEARAERLRTSEKERAENVMIVDMVRNDLGRVAETGSVVVNALWEAEQFPTVWQLTSTVRGRTSAGLTQLMRALFPPASITGAPKVSTMRILRELEESPRKAYTGAIGFLSPGDRCQLNVAIRTVILDRQHQMAEYGVGGGIVWDSSAESELEECRTKARMLTHAPPEFSLLETLVWRPGEGLPLLELHLRRLTASARYFEVPVDLTALRTALRQATEDLPRQPHKLRVEVAAGAPPRIEVGPVELPSAKTRLALAREPVDPQDPFLYHKTTHRQVYERALAGRPPECDDVLLWNEHGEVTESCMANVIVERDGSWLTPPLRCGLLPGIGRQRLLDEGRAREQRILVDELRSCDRILLVNAVRGVWEAELASPNRRGDY
jgi:para-aminobenzoate synthetase/4-amino-4-deoxychorismate lyase